MQIIDEGIQFTSAHMADVVPQTEALDDDAIAQRWCRLPYEKVRLGLGYGNGSVVAHGILLARGRGSVDALAISPVTRTVRDDRVAAV